ncbi:ATP12-domain-containing protein [Metschnikowia bicuspidata var. bicuspidata NRRL YB-4993]|uniref:ATP12-domain-containing protein n=1 Tax=Metschnikowia bicuspidata var. bicuspidata NRRL YB-4993 TaxID=869754 RepID=A0A1A0H8M9_9ASCO|nr:ATP12-domain-containing protein [Metschnikowia bicuspidata var. bicuspidata NRRL YB-4993]OBA20350.1 ATP12-domain-containing protein [Metschnikowia bicuspidata var. bicuspidata NRRL YB-4993]
MGRPRLAAAYATSSPLAPQTPVGGDINNIKSETNRLEKTLNKFWTNVDARLNPELGAYEICLDGKPLKTPLGSKLTIPQAKKQLAYLVSHEWDSLCDLKIRPNSLPLTSMVSRAVDLQLVHQAKEVDANLVAKIGDLQDIKLNMLRYLDTDTCLIFTTEDDNEGRLRKRQLELYRPLIAEYESFFSEFARKHRLLPADSPGVELQFLDCETDGLCGNSQSISTQNVVLQWLDRLPIYDLVALEKAILSSKSFLCGATVLRSNTTDEKTVPDLYQVNKQSPDTYFRKSVEEIVELGNLETIFQTAEWGEVEDTHDVDKADWLRNLSSAALLCR